jgi:ribosomal-protein-alanine N-acetyltransferase
MLRIRAATPEDLSTLLQLEREADAAAHWPEADYERLFAADAPRRLVLLAEEEGALGFVVARAAGPEWEIENLAVRGTARRIGVGMALVTALLRLARSEAVRNIMLEVRESNLPARALYVASGFTEMGRRRGYYRNPMEDAILYWHELTAATPESR